MNSAMADDKPSKTQLKREMLALQAMGESLVKLPERHLALIEMPDVLREAVTQARAMHKHGALNRQRQYIGKLMRGIDCESVRVGLAKLQKSKQEQAAIFKRSENWRDRMLNEGDIAIQEFVQAVQQAERQRLRQWVRDAQQEKQLGKTPRSARLLFRYVHKILQDEL